MIKPSLFIGVAQQQGFSLETAQAAFDALCAQLVNYGYGHTACATYYVYRTETSASETGEQRSTHPRTLVAFPSPDAALAFAQHHRLGASPRLVEVSVDQLLTVLIRHPAIRVLIFADEGDEQIRQHSLPSGLRLERDALLTLLQERI